MQELLKCAVCSYMTEEVRDLKMHIMSHTGKTPDSCFKCNFTCSVPNILKAHMLNHLYACFVCDYTCSQHSTIRRHMKIHGHPKPFSCSLCSAKFAQHAQLKSHKTIVHLVKKPYLCSKCDYSFPQGHLLKEHMLTHATPAFSCNMCNYKSKNESTLKNHLLTHNDETSYICVECKFKSHSAYGLKKHVWNHFSPFTCVECDYSFARSNDLRQHIKIHTRELLPRCAECKVSCKSCLTFKSLLKFGKDNTKSACTECNCLLEKTKSYVVNSTRCRKCKNNCLHCLTFKSVFKGEADFKRSPCEDCICMRIVKSAESYAYSSLKNEKTYNFSSIMQNVTKKTSLDSSKICCVTNTSATISPCSAASIPGTFSGEDKYSCAECSFTCSKPTIFKSHKLMHIVTEQFLCTEIEEIISICSVEDKINEDDTTWIEDLLY